jgi:hypothetical protein
MMQVAAKLRIRMRVLLGSSGKGLLNKRLRGGANALACKYFKPTAFLLSKV